MSKALR